MRAPNHPWKHQSYSDALTRVLCVAPLDMWPDTMKFLFFGDSTIKRGERLRLSSFLFGNGACSEDIVPLLAHRLRDDPARTDVRNTVTQMNTADGMARIFYFDVNERDYLYLNGTCKEGDVRGYRVLQRMINSWSKYAYLKPTTLEMQRRFMMQREFYDAFTFCAFFQLESKR